MRFKFNILCILVLLLANSQAQDDEGVVHSNKDSLRSAQEDEENGVVKEDNRSDRDIRVNNYVPCNPLESYFSITQVKLA